MGTVVIGSDSFDVYGTVALCLSYLAGSRSSQAAAFRKLTADGRGQCLIEASRALDLEAYLGNRTSPTQAHAWPRSGVMYTDGTTTVVVDPATFPTDILGAAYELAALYAKSANLGAKKNTGKNIQSVGGGGAPQVVFFAPVKGDRFPATVDRLLQKFLGGDNGVDDTTAHTQSTGTDRCDPFRDLDPLPLRVI